MLLFLYQLNYYLTFFSQIDPAIVLNPTVSYRKLLSMPHVIVVCFILAVASQAQGFIDPTLEPHMRQVSSLQYFILHVKLKNILKAFSSLLS